LVKANHASPSSNSSFPASTNYAFGKIQFIEFNDRFSPPSIEAKLNKYKIPIEEDGISKPI